ncbi:isoprenylcysteine carboxyl methyltransferase family protein [Peribacillus alkalitolerans]|uniref:isoprenylcysteine carboxyl methyltransferase family protein n=1 Tax=Peribacillus alkalitolerans TaxID=1550385 RepID=UPI0013D742BF|nr:isoprenylcysteine carboxylmethyltransferase family protein [Peribacillus alkalitolerans]
MFKWFLLFILLQRAIELGIAKSNEKWMKKNGGVEFGQTHYIWMIAMHTLFFISLYTEVSILQKSPSKGWPLLLIIFILAQFIRVWALYSLGRHWNTKIIVIPNVNVIKKGPYRYVRHPNYAIVAMEIAVVSLLFNAFFTFVLFSIANAIMMYVRIPLEEQALRTLTDYNDHFGK